MTSIGQHINSSLLAISESALQLKQSGLQGWQEMPSKKGSICTCISDDSETESIHNALRLSTEEYTLGFKSENQDLQNIQGQQDMIGAGEYCTVARELKAAPWLAYNQELYESQVSP